WRRAGSWRSAPRDGPGATSGRPGHLADLRAPRPRAGELDDERRPRARLALDADLPLQRADDLLDDPEAEADAAEVARRRRQLEALEDPLLIAGRDADAVVSHAQARRVAVLDAELDRLAVAVLERVRQQVGDHLLDPALVPAPH